MAVQSEKIARFSGMVGTFAVTRAGLWSPDQISGLRVVHSLL